MKAARVHAALAFEATYYSVTIRGRKIPKKTQLPTWKCSKAWKCADKKTAWTTRLESMLHAAGLTETKPEDARKAGFLEGQHRLGEVLYQGIFHDTSLPHATGLVLVTGATASGKTK